MAISPPWSLDALVDLARYPIHDPEAASYRKVVADAQAGLAAQGAAELEGFLTAEGLDAVIADAIELEAVAHRAAGPATAYLEYPDQDAPIGHPRRWLGTAAVAAVAYDLFPTTSPLRWIYESEDVLRFLDDILDRGTI